ncbi:DASH complex, subunit Duo1 [Cordyceps fumosorosea ARSEF 2679]|uniref:DASH complex subunit DUO1 n=1 Tax=Cordyceps fumosorosea (strain ARSEF 2679) TaxID=1081104 RepID=A0A162MLP5_CORFA|nr:DASH complex, subunit Duo1 [Cordyceps fumosorosea ARSEF 2679]OAA63850.1 DASH complex, subunit Duo1 [Cordyceps fumosorosea ARSEF 2679]
MADDSEYTETDIWASPQQTLPQKAPRTPKTPRTPRTPASEGPDRDALLRKELEGVKNVNEAIEGLIGTLERAGGNMDVVTQTVNNASTLLNTWTRILSQTEHNQRLILDPRWKGTTEDLAEQEAEALQRQQEAERKAREEEQRREELRRRREEEETKRRLAPGTRSLRGTASTRSTASSIRARAGSRIGAGSSYLSHNTSSSSSRGTSGIGRGTGTVRGTRSRGTR